jgi:diguanylate cyclase (GGDEF)-like protein
MLSNAARRAQEICDGVRDLRVEHQGRQIGVLTVSIGVTALSAGAKTGPDLLRAADAALYQAKHAGRNCVALNENGELSIRTKDTQSAARPASAGA